MQNYMYNSKINCHQNTHTTIKTGYLNANQNDELRYKIVNIYGINSANNITVDLKNQDDLFDFKLITYLSNSNAVKYDFGYDYICYCSINEISSKCSGKFYHASDITSFLAVVRDNPEIMIVINKDLIIPYPTGDHYILNPANEKISISLPDSPESITVLENDHIIVKYIDSTYVEILSKAIINVDVKDTIILNILDSTQSTLTFSLESNVMISPESQINANFTISVVKNEFHLYAEDVDKFLNIFGDSIELHNSVCAYELNADSYCSFTQRKNINDVFKSPFKYNKVEIAPISNNQNIILPIIDKEVDVNILPDSTASLEISLAKNLDIMSEIVKINKDWRFTGDLNTLSVKLDTESSFSIPESISYPITIQLTKNQTNIDLLNCAIQDTKQITISKFDETSNVIMVYGNLENYNNFKNALIKYDDIKIYHNGTQKYLCICDNSEAYEKCSENIDGIIDSSKELLYDPGDDVEIRFFKDIEISSNDLSYKHNALINTTNKLNITNVKAVYQDIENQLKVDNLIFTNGSNLLLKPRDPTLNITMSTGNKGKPFSIEIDTFLKLNVVNSNEINLNASLLYVSGKGELNLFDYPIERVNANSTVKLIKGVYTICNSKNGDNVCSYDSAEGYKNFGNSYDFRDDFDPNSKIVVFLDSFISNIDVNIRYLRGQKIQFMRKPNSARQLENNNKLRFLSTTEINCKADETFELSGSSGGALLNGTDSDLFVVGFEDNLIIKQEKSENNIQNNVLTIEPLKENVTITVDESVDLDTQKIKIENNDDKDIMLTVISKKNLSDTKKINNLFDIDSQKVTIKIESQNDPTSTETIVTTSHDLSNPTKDPNENNSKKKLPTGVIAGIVVGIIALIAIVVVCIILISMKKRKGNIENNLNDLSDDESIGL